MHLRDRIGAAGKVREWIPDFQYHLIRIHDFSNQELLERGDEMSLIMLINKIQDAADLEQFIRIPPDKIDRIIRDSPEHVIDVLVSAMESLCFKIDASAEERTQCVQKVRGRKMGYLFENMQHISIQEERRKTEEQRRKTEEQRIRAENAEEKLKLAEETIQQLRKKYQS